MSVRGRPMLALFLVSLAAVGYEIALTRYFAVAKWSEYGYWVISIVMVGFALSGVILALWRDIFVRHAERLMAALPTLLVASAAATTSSAGSAGITHRACRANESRASANTTPDSANPAMTIEMTQ